MLRINFIVLLERVHVGITTFTSKQAKDFIEGNG